jgi:anthranilate/para-aminobenzoate synthase component I
LLAGRDWIGLAAMSGVAGLAPRALLEPHRHLPGAFCIDRIDGRTCFAGSLPSSQLVVDASGTVHRMRNGVWSVLSEEPIDAISRFFEDSRVTPAFLPDGIDADEPLPRTVGYLGYELGRWIEHVPVAVADPLRLPLAVLSTYDAADVWSPARERVERIRFVASQCTPPLDTIAAALAASPATCTATDLRTDNDRYERGFRRIKQAIAAGEIYQANLSWRTTWRTPRTPSLSWQQLCRRQPVPHGFYFDCSAFQVLGNSPECFLEVRGRAVRTSPIK